MAEDPQVEAPDEEGGEEARPKSWLRILVLLVGLSVGGTAGVFLLGPSVGRALTARESGDGHGADQGGGHGATVETVHVIENLVVNPAGTEGRRFLLVSMALEPADGDVGRLETLEPELRAVVIPILAARSVEELLDLSRREELTTEVSEALDEVVGGDGLRRVLFPQFVVQ
jgi:flagellar FliL protein